MVNRYGMSFSQMTTDMFACCSHIRSLLSLFMTCYRIFSKSDTPVSNNEAGNVYPYEEPNSFLKFSGLHVAQSLVFCVVFYILFSVLCDLSFCFVLTVLGLRVLVTSFVQTEMDKIKLETYMDIENKNSRTVYHSV